MVGGQAHLSQDVPPFVTIDGETTTVVGLNIIGLRRAGFSSEAISQLKQAYRVIYRSGLTWSDTLRALSEQFKSGHASEFRGVIVKFRDSSDGHLFDGARF
jgi:UDP-N-acetylglucosamine acyltransferase